MLAIIVTILLAIIIWFAGPYMVQNAWIIINPDVDITEWTNRYRYAALLNIFIPVFCVFLFWVMREFWNRTYGFSFVFSMFICLILLFFENIFFKFGYSYIIEGFFKISITLFISAFLLYIVGVLLVSSWYRELEPHMFDPFYRWFVWPWGKRG